MRRCRFNLWMGNIPRRRKWQPTPVFLLAKSQVHTGAWQATDHEVPKESDSTKQLNHSKSRNPYYSLAGELPACTSCITRNSLPHTPPLPSDYLKFPSRIALDCPFLMPATVFPWFLSHLPSSFLQRHQNQVSFCCLGARRCHRLLSLLLTLTMALMLTWHHGGQRGEKAGKWMRKWEGETHSTLSSVMEGQMFWKMEAEESRGTYPWTRSPWWELTFLTQAAAGKTDENLGCIFGRVRVSSEMGAKQRSRCKMFSSMSLLLPCIIRIRNFPFWFCSQKGYHSYISWVFPQEFLPSGAVYTTCFQPLQRILFLRFASIWCWWNVWDVTAECWLDVVLYAWGSQGSRHVVNEERWTMPLPVLSMNVAGTRVVERESGHC